MNLVPLGGKIVVKRDLADTQTPGGILLPDSAKGKPARGKVLAVGPGKLFEGKRQKPDVHEGQQIVFSNYSGREIEVGKDTVLVLEEDDILGVLQ